MGHEAMPVILADPIAWETTHSMFKPPMCKFNLEGDPLGRIGHYPLASHLDRAQTQSEQKPTQGASGAAGGEARAAAARDLPELKCRLSTRDPVLDYEFRFYAPFWVNIPVRRLVGGGRRLSSTALIHPVSVEGAQPVLVEDTYELGQEVPDGARGEAELGGAFALSGVLQAVLVDVTPGDPLTLLTVTVVLTAVALAACLLPVRRATRIDPLAALRQE